MPYWLMRAVEPIVAYGLREFRTEGANREHILREVALMGALVGTGMPAAQAIRLVEAMEPQLLGMPRGETQEPDHAGYPDMGGWGKGFPWMGFPGMGFPGMGFPGKGYPGMGYPGMGYPGMGYPGMGGWGKDGFGKGMMGPWGKMMPGPMGWPQGGQDPMGTQPQ